MSAPAAAARDIEVDLAAIRTAHARIAPYIHRTPVLSSRSLDEAAGARLFFKCENLQKVAAFKARGACNAVLSLSAAEAKHGVVTHSSGNHGAALASRLLAIYEGLVRVIDEFRPDEAAVEATFVNKDASATLKLRFSCVHAGDPRGVGKRGVSKSIGDGVLILEILAGRGQPHRWKTLIQEWRVISSAHKPVLAEHHLDLHRRHESLRNLLHIAAQLP